MFDQPPSMAMRAAIASFLGSLFGIGLILATHTAQAQTIDAAAETEAAVDPAAIIRRIGDVTLRSLSGAESLLSGRAPAPLGLRLHAGSEAPANGLRWQVTRMPGLRSEGEIPRSRDLISVGVQLRF
ncbi:MAG: hypothetical protein V4792_04855 [Pseudomonadota bacterium]